MYSITLSYRENRLMLDALKAEHISSRYLTVLSKDRITGSVNYMFTFSALNTMLRVISRYPLYISKRLINSQLFDSANNLYHKLDPQNNILSA